MATITFIKRNKRTIMTKSSSSLRCISAAITSSSYNGRNSNSNSSTNDLFNNNNFFSLRQYASKTIDSCTSSNSSKKPQQFTYTSQKGDTAGHMVGSSILKRIRKNEEGVIIKRFDSFTAQWIEETGHSWPSKCSTKGCSNKPNVGAHIFIHKREYAYLVPMCHKCNMTPMKNFIPIETIDERSRFPFHLDNGTACVELTHIHISKQTYIYIDRPAWPEMLNRFIAYSKKHNSPLVPYRYKPDPELGRWVTTQRRQYKRDRLTLKQIELLNSNGFVWVKLEYQWDENIKLLVKFKDREGHCNVPKHHKENGNNLGVWVHNQRQDKKNGKLDTERVKQLEELGVVWDLFSKQWYEWFTLLVQFKQREGHCNVPHNHKEDGANIGIWLSDQRQAMKNGKLDTVKEKQLEELGVVWNLFSKQWYEWFTLLVQFKQREGHCNVPHNHKEDGANIGIWLSDQRQAMKNGKLDTVKEKQLEELGVVWNILEYQWYEWFTLLVQFKDREGHCNVPKRHTEDGANIGVWLDTQRQNERNGKLDTVKEKQLEELGVVWEPLSEQWEEMYTHLATYKQRERHCNVPWNHEEEGKTLGSWVYKQHYYKRDGKMSEDRQHRLEEIGIIFLTFPGSE